MAQHAQEFEDHDVLHKVLHGNKRTWHLAIGKILTFAYNTFDGKTLTPFLVKFVDYLLVNHIGDLTLKQMLRDSQTNPARLGFMIFADATTDVSKWFSMYNYIY